MNLTVNAPGYSGRQRGRMDWISLETGPWCPGWSIRRKPTRVMYPSAFAVSWLVDYAHYPWAALVAVRALVQFICEQNAPKPV